MRLAIDTSGAEHAMVVLDGHRLLAAEDWVRSRDDAPVLARLDALVKRARGRADDLDGVSAALLDSAIWTFEYQKPLRYDEVQALYVQPAAAEERRRKAP